MLGFREIPVPTFGCRPSRMRRFWRALLDSVAVREAFRSFRWQTIGRQHGDRVALNQRRSDQRMGENDAWQAAIADCREAVVVGHDPKAFARLGQRYDDHQLGSP